MRAGVWDLGGLVWGEADAVLKGVSVARGIGSGILRAVCGDLGGRLDSLDLVW